MQASLRFTLILLSALLALIGQISGGPLYDICEWKDAVPEFHVWYREPECNPIWRPLPNGDCETGKGQPGLCSSLCLKRTIFHYGQEKPYDHVPPCRGPMKCSFSEKTTTGYNFKGKFSDSVKIATFNLGIPGGFNVKGGDSQSWKLEKTLKEGECGYWSFIPYVHESCGIFTEYRVNIYECHKEYPTIPDICPEQPVELAPGKLWWSPRSLRGDVIVVKIDCYTHELLPDDQQDPAYRDPGVKLPRHYHPYMDSLMAMWKETADNPDFFIAAEADIKCHLPNLKSDAYPKNLDPIACVEALGHLYDVSGLVISGKDEVMLAAAPNCSIHAKIDSGSADSCQFSYMQAAMGMGSLRETCNNKLQVPGSYPLISHKDPAGCRGRVGVCPGQELCL